jgi:hypothetical protein
MKRIILSTVIYVLLLVVRASAQGLTDAQYQVLNTDITVTHQAEFATAVAASDYAVIAAAYNLQAAPPFWVWKTLITPKQIYQSVVEGQKWSWATYKGQTQQERDSWRDMMQPNELDPSLQQTRDGFLAIFGGQGASQVQVTYLLTLSRRQALRGETLFANTSQGAGTTAAPALLTYQGTLTYNDVYYALTGQRP